MIIDCVSDLHGNYPELEGGDVLIVAGDLTASDKAYQYIQFFMWFDKQKYKHRILVAGNHDNVLKEYPPTYGTWHYLCDSGVEIEGVKFWGSPWTKTFPGMNPHCKAFTFDTEKELADKWEMIPLDTDILITHSPPYGVLDKTERGECVGSKTLQMAALRFHSLKLWVMGHIHEAYGEEWPGGNYPGKIVNASHVNERYQPVNKPIRIIL